MTLEDVCTLAGARGVGNVNRRIRLKADWRKGEKKEERFGQRGLEQRRVEDGWRVEGRS